MADQIIVQKIVIFLNFFTLKGCTNLTGIKVSIDRNISTVITSEEMKSNPIFFDIRFVEGQYQIIINKAHPAYLDFFNLVI